jgi:hypothetical protein
VFEPRIAGFSEELMDMKEWNDKGVVALMENCFAPFTLYLLQCSYFFYWELCGRIPVVYKTTGFRFLQVERCTSTSEVQSFASPLFAPPPPFREDAESRSISTAHSLFSGLTLSSIKLVWEIRDMPFIVFLCITFETQGTKIQHFAQYISSVTGCLTVLL